MKNSNFKMALAATMQALLGFHLAQAAIPEPDNLLYGSITLDNLPVTAERTDVIIEARRATNGPALVSYRMGSNPALGDFYSLQIPLESVTPLTNLNASQIGASIFVTVLDGAGLRAQTGFVITDRGTAQRIDFGVAVIDGDGDGLPDSWELLHFSNLGQAGNSPAANGQTVWQNYLAGTDPKDPQDGFRLIMAESNQLKSVSFQTRRATGPGYEGLTRLYTLETQSDPSGPAWSGVTGFIQLPGNDQTVVYQTTANGGAAFFRGKISLQPGVGAPGTNDIDADGLPDTWEMLYFGNLNTTSGSLNANGQTALQNFVTGAAPTNSGGVFKLNLSRNGGNSVVSFQTHSAQGIGYEGKQRFYALESSPTPGGPWQIVSGLGAIVANDQPETYSIATQSGPLFFRARVWLQP